MTKSDTVYVDPVAGLGALLLNVDKPERYCGGEYGRLAKKDAGFQTLIAFPDLYEIGMSNQSFRIIYNNLNNISGISCDRAFAPAPDLEKLLREKGLPLYGLDTGISLKSLDLLLFTLGYELGFSGILAMLDISGIPLRSNLRNENDPLVIAGGPAVSNPLPYSAFIDAFWIGEAEAGFFDLAAQLRDIKLNGGGRTEMFEYIKNHPNIWVKGKEKTVRAVDAGFAVRKAPPAVYPVPSMKTVQLHGTLEIMRGCPNGCRFCHAGFWYRPMRQKPPQTLVREAGDFITCGGYREISLSSLSSGDYSGIGELVGELNSRFSEKRVSFQLPSLKVSSFNLSLLEKISQTRKSGLTFAVETPLDFWQLAVNKRVTEDSVTEILREAKRNGWRGAKFYFMLGLPVPPPDNEDVLSDEDEIVNFINNIARKTSMHFNINVGIFVPKPHTPYQWSCQIDSETAVKKLDYIRSRLKPRGHKVSISDPLISMLEGVLSRGDERAGVLVEEAFHAGSRLDAWNEFIDKNAWRVILEKNSNLVNEFLNAKDLAAPLPWHPVFSGVSPAYLRNELEKSVRGELTPPCIESCADRCGVCNDNSTLAYNRNEKPFVTHSSSIAHCSLLIDKLPTHRMLFSFTKEGSAVFHGHLSLIEIFSMAFVRAGLDVLYTQGFNPLAKLEIVSPLSVGITASAEIAAVDFSGAIQPGEFIEKMNAALPEGIKVTRAEYYIIPFGAKKHSLSSLLWGFGYSMNNEQGTMNNEQGTMNNEQGTMNNEQAGEIEYVTAKEEKVLREKLLASDNMAAGMADGRARVFSLRRCCVLAKNIVSDGNMERPCASYFDVYGQLTEQLIKNS